MILLIDNYDSFTYNLAQYIACHTEVQVIRNDDDKLYQAVQDAEGIVLSPGPGWPADAGQMEDVIREFAGVKPILGICLGHQAIAEVFGGKLGLAKNVMHGKQSQMQLTSQSPIFDNLPKESDIMRYHSIVIDDMPKDFEIVAKTTDDHEIMAIQNQDLAIYGLQYHPESIGTEDGMGMIKNFIDLVERSKDKRIT